MTSFPLSRRCAGLLVAATVAVCASPAWAQQKRVAIANFGEDPSLLVAIKGFKEAMAQNGFVEGKNVSYSVSHTNFDASLLPQMIAKLQSEKPDLMLTVTTPVSQIAKKALASSGIPLVFTAVTDPVAAKLVPSWSSGDTGMTGSSDLQDVAAVMAFTRQLLPNAKTFGLPYNPGEANDVALVAKANAAAAGAGMTVVTVGVDTPNDVQQRIASFKGKADMVYNPTSNLLQPAVGAVAAGARSVGLPVINATEDPVRKGQVLASFSVNYELVGFNAGVIAAKVLKGADPKTIPPVLPALKDHAPLISKKVLASLNLTLPASLANCNCLVD